MLFGTKKEEKRDAAERRDYLKRHALHKIHELKSRKVNESSFHELMGVVMEFLEGYFHLHKTVTCDEIESILLEKHLKEDVGRKVGILLETMSRIKYGGIELTTDEFNELIDETEQVIKELR